MEPTTTSRRILIISIFYAPEATGIAPYTTGFAEYLADNACQVRVLTTMPSYPHWRVHPEYRGVLRKWESRGAVEVQRVRSYVPDGQSVLKRGIYESSFLLAGLSGLTRPAPDAVLAVVPALSCGVLARIAARRFGCAYGLVMQDLTGPAATQTGVTGRRTGGLVRAIEAWVAQAAAVVGIIAEGFRPYVESLGVDAERIHRVRNWGHVDEPTLSRTSVRQRLNLPQEAVICLHAGNMGLKQGLTNVIDCARLAVQADPRLLFVLMGDGSQRERLVALAQRYKLPNLRFLPVQPAELFSSVLAAADILLLNQRASVSSMSLPSKLTSYMMAGRPVVVAAQPNSEAALEVSKAMAGVICVPERPEAMLRSILELTCSPSLRERLGANGVSYSKWHLNPKNVLPRWASLVDCIANSSGTIPGPLSDSPVTPRPEGS
jgi:colanic acid biosynthesis glycosyl transferase WcaI